MPSIHDILSDFYRGTLDSLSGKDKGKAAVLIEEGLTDGRTCLAVPVTVLEKQFGVSSTFLMVLSDKRLLRPNYTYGEPVYQIMHDSLLQVILEARDERRKSEAVKEAIKKEEKNIQNRTLSRVRFLIWCMLVIGVVFLMIIIITGKKI